MTARKFASVKFPDAFVEDARREAALFNRSVAGQIEHWARLGRALEGVHGFSIERLRQALAGQLKLEDLNALEREAFFANMHIWLDNPSPEEVEAYAEIGRQPGAVGLDEAGRLVRVPAEGGPPIVIDRRG